MTGTAQEDIDLLRGAIDGPVIGPADVDYDDARKVMNAAIDRRPAVIARCLSATEVSAAIKFARERRWEVSVRGGAHSTAGHGVCDDGLMIDLSQIRHVSVDPAECTSPRRRGRPIGGHGCGDTGLWARGASRCRQQHWGRRPDFGWRHGLAHPQTRAHRG